MCTESLSTNNRPVCIVLDECLLHLQAGEVQQVERLSEQIMTVQKPLRPNSLVKHDPYRPAPCKTPCLPIVFFSQLPTELWQMIATLLPKTDRVSLQLCSKVTQVIYTNEQAIQTTKVHRELLRRLRRDWHHYPHLQICVTCCMSYDRSDAQPRVDHVSVGSRHAVRCDGRWSSLKPVRITVDRIICARCCYIMIIDAKNRPAPIAAAGSFVTIWLHCWEIRWNKGHLWLNVASTADLERNKHLERKDVWRDREDWVLDDLTGATWCGCPGVQKVSRRHVQWHLYHALIRSWKHLHNVLFPTTEICRTCGCKYAFSTRSTKARVTAVVKRRHSLMGL
jgi:hypothetical protein